MKKRIFAAGLFAVLFLILLLLVRTVDVAAIGPAGTEIGLSHLNAAAHAMTGVRFGLYDVTQYLGYLAILTGLGFACAGLVQLIRRKRLKAVDRELLALGALYVALGCLYVLFEKAVVNYRPVLMPGADAPEASFPSSHTMLAAVIFGAAAMLLPRYVKDRTARAVLTALCVALAAATVLLRFASGVHWLTDICAGVLLSGALLSLFAAALWKERR